jgi:hypothetical protein
MNCNSKSWEQSQKHPSRTASLPLPLPCYPPETQPRQHKHPASSASPTIFDESTPPEYTLENEIIEPPTFSQVILTLDPTRSLIQPITNPSEDAIPLYSISTKLDEGRRHVTTIQRLYHKPSDSPISSSKEAKIKTTPLPVYEIGPGRTRCELRSLLESASCLKLVHAERNITHSTLQWEFNIRTEKAGVDRNANTKNELVMGKTEKITRHMYRAQSVLGTEDAVEWVGRNNEVVAYEQQVAKRRKPKLRTKSEATAEYSETIDLRQMSERSPRRGKRASAGFSESYGEILLPTVLLPMPTLKIVKSLERNEMEYVFPELDSRASIVKFP